MQFSGKKKFSFNWSFRLILVYNFDLCSELHRSATAIQFCIISLWQSLKKLQRFLWKF
jgi:hypothetical protein